MGLGCQLNLLQLVVASCSGGGISIIITRKVLTYTGLQLTSDSRIDWVKRTSLNMVGANKLNWTLFPHSYLDLGMCLDDSSRI